MASQHVVALWRGVPGVYVFARRSTAEGFLPTRIGPTRVLERILARRAWIPLYVGQSKNLAGRLQLEKREHWKQAVALGATHVHARIARIEYERRDLERRLIEALQPTLNIRYQETRARRRSAHGSFFCSFLCNLRVTLSKVNGI